MELRFPIGVQETILDSFEGIAKRTEVLPDRVLLYTEDGDRTIADVHTRGLDPEAIVVRRSTLEDVFLRLTGRSLID